ncbi:MAG: RNA polymerase sigma factor [Acidobacteria bacterium]|nr:RNA polymerase sigma factor [Acidobacteriota bacterium]
MPDEQRDECLLRRARRGDEGAFLAIYERHHAAMFRFACRLLASRAAAEDVVHDCFLDLVRARDDERGDEDDDGSSLSGSHSPEAPSPPSRFDPARGSLRSYLYGMVRHRALKVFRRAARECEFDGAEGDGDGRNGRRAREPCAGGEPLARLLDAELGEIVRRAVGELPPLQREALILFEYEGLSLAEVAGVVGADAGTVKARLFRARRSLRRTLAPHLSPCGAELAAKD